MSAGHPNDSSGYPDILDLTKGEGGAPPPSATQTYYMGDSEDDGSASGVRRPGTPGKVVESGREHTGRWTREEHAAFLSALKQYGKEWKKVAAKVKTRTVVQTRTHAQKYFQKLQKAMNGSDGKPGSVDMGIDSRSKGGGGANKKRKVVKPPPQRSQSTASTHAAAHLMTHLSGGKGPMLGFPASDGSFVTPSAYAAHGFSGAGPSAAANDQPLLPPQAYPQSGLFNRGGFQGGKPMSIVAPDPDIHNRMGKFPEPSPAACGKRKLAEIAAAQMLAGVMGGEGKPYSEATKPPALKLPGPGDVTPPGEPPKLPLSGSSTPPKQSGFSLQIVNPETLGVTYEKTTKKKRTHSDSSPMTPWDGQLKALVSETQRMSDEKKPKEKDDEESEDVKTPEVALDSSGFPHPVCGPGTGFGRSALHKAVCEMNIDEIKNQLAVSPNVLKRDDAGFSPLHTACALSLMDEAYSKVACDICGLLTSTGTDAACLDSAGNTPLHWAARAGDVDVAHFILMKNSQTDLQNDQGETALHVAMRAGRKGMKVVKLLLDNGARNDVFSKQSKRPLDVAAEGFSIYDGTEEKKQRKPSKAARKRITDEKREVRAHFLSLSASSRTLVLHHPECLEHVPKSATDWECPDRVESIMRRIQPDPETTEMSGIFPIEVTVSTEFDRAKLNLLSRVHSADYLSFVNDLSKDLEKKHQEENKHDEESTKRVPPAGVPFTPMVQRTVMKEADFKNIKQADHSDTSFSAGSLRAARRAAGAVQHAVDCVLVGRNRNAFCVVRPPGHHAGIKGLLAGGESCGFCIFNNVAAGALHAVADERALCRRCAIVDLDVHHGNGTEEIVRKCHDPARLFFFSIHLYDNDKKKRGSPAVGYKFYPGTGEEDDLAHNIINVPIRPLWKESAPPPAPAAVQNTHNTRQKVKQRGNSPTRDSQTGDDTSLTETKASDTESEVSSRVAKPSESSTPAASPRYVNTGRNAYRRAIQDRLLPALRAFNPDLILISAGFDAAKGDVGNARHYIGGKESMGLDLEPGDYGWATRKILEVADICCNGRVVSVLEGGYGRTPIATADESTPTLDKTIFSECAVRHLQAMIDPYDAEARFSR